MVDDFIERCSLRGFFLYFLLFLIITCTTFFIDIRVFGFQPNFLTLELIGCNVFIIQFLLELCICSKLAQDILLKKGIASSVLSLLSILFLTVSTRLLFALFSKIMCNILSAIFSLLFGITFAIAFGVILFIILSSIKGAHT